MYAEVATEVVAAIAFFGSNLSSTDNFCQTDEFKAIPFRWRSLCCLFQKLSSNQDTHAEKSVQHNNTAVHDIDQKYQTHSVEAVVAFERRETTERDASYSTP
jgi:hypothetical protein